MTGNKAYLSNFKSLDGQAVSFGGGIGGKVSGKGTIKAGNLDFENVYCHNSPFQVISGTLEKHYS